MENALKAYDNFSDQKHARDYVRIFEADLQQHLQEIVQQIIDESWQPKGYVPKVIFDRKRRLLAKAPIEDHVLESATILPFEKSIYDYSTWRAPAVKPKMGTHGLLRFLRNELYRWSQEDMAYYVAIDVHHYFPTMDHAILKDALSRMVKPGKLLAIRFKKIIQTFTTTDFNGEEQETYQFEKKRDEKGQPTTQDAEFYTFTGSKIMIDQALNDFTREDLPVPTVIQQFRGKDGKEYTKFT